MESEHNVNRGRDCAPSHRSYKTIGIGNVFVARPTPSDGPLTNEIVGTIKTTPEDFVVREIACPQRMKHAIRRERDLVADLSISYNTVPSPSNSGQSGIPTDGGSCETVSSDRHIHSKQVSESQTNREGSLPPTERIQRILRHHFGADDAMVIFQSIEKLHETVLKGLRTGQPQAGDMFRSLTLPLIPSDVSSLGFDEIRSGDCGTFHRALKAAFPVLQSKTFRDVEKPTIKIYVDDTFLPLAGFLLDPQESLQKLYAFRKAPRSDLSDTPNMPNRGRKRKRSGKADPTLDLDTTNSALLPFIPNISKDERRKAHHIVARGCGDFITSTISDYSFKTTKPDDSSSPLQVQTSALLVMWSKRKGRSKNRNKKLHKNTLFVLKKRQREHLTAMQCLAKALNCHVGDIATAGIKDMQAITFQFCTARNRSTKDMEAANQKLTTNAIEIGSFVEVDWELTRGENDGNRFRITLRDLKRVEIDPASTAKPRSESFVPCDKAHLQGRVNAIERNGFVNFFGSQRVGVPGSFDEVGVRPFDIGRAMLKGDFDRAIDLLMIGRRVTHANGIHESEEIRNARRVWSESRRDVTKTLSAMPKGNIMSRERCVLQGLKRYRNSRDAFKTIPFSVRLFWINAYQSLVWNSMATRRLEEFGARVVLGDQVRRDDGTVTIVAPDDISRFTIESIVLPLPGYNVEYPQNLKQMYEEFLSNDTVEFKKDAPPEETAKGAYRKLVVRPTNVSVAFPGDTTFPSEVLLGFDLSTGSYATSLLRELMVSTVMR